MYGPCSLGRLAPDRNLETLSKPVLAQPNQVVLHSYDHWISADTSSFYELFCKEKKRKKYVSALVFLCLLVLIHWYLIKLIALDYPAPTAQWISKNINMLNIVWLSCVWLCCGCRLRQSCNAGTAIRQARQGVSPELATVCGRNVHRLGPDLHQQP